MDIAGILRPENVRFDAQASSKKHALDVLSQILAESAENLTAGEILEGLANRERLGSTGLGQAVAMPHAKVRGIPGIVGAFLKLAKPVDFESEDGIPVDLFFALLVPIDADSGELKELRRLVEKLRDPSLQKALRVTDDPQAIHRLLTDRLTAAPRAINA
jgi:PTS system nitrogen regulatory IIA component